MNDLTLEEAMEELLQINLRTVSDYMLLPSLLVEHGKPDRRVFHVIDGLAYATICFDGGFEEAIVASGDTPQKAIQKAKETLHA